MSVDDRLVLYLAKHTTGRRSALRRELGVGGSALREVLDRVCEENDGVYGLKKRKLNADVAAMPPPPPKVKVKGMWTSAYLPPSASFESCVVGTPTPLVVVGQDEAAPAPPPQPTSPDFIPHLYTCATTPLPALPPLTTPHHYRLYLATHSTISTRLIHQREVLSLCHPRLPPWCAQHVVALHTQDASMIDLMKRISVEVAAYSSGVSTTHRSGG